jgi:hypothetical protein
MMSILMAIAGGLGWTASEYVLHRFVGHGPKRKPRETILGRLTPGGLLAEFNREHLAHHTDTQYFAPTSRKMLAAVTVLPVFTLLLTPLVGIASALSFAGGFAVVYALYELFHRRIHTHAPRGPITRWMRRHHLLHHHKSPKLNHGVTSPLWDVFFGTLTPLGKLRIPRRHAPPWMLGEDGEVRPEYREDYELVGRVETQRAPVEEVEQVVEQVGATA